MGEKLDVELALNMYKLMFKIREFDEIATKFAKRGKILGFVIAKYFPILKSWLVIESF